MSFWTAHREHGKFWSGVFVGAMLMGIAALGMAVNCTPLIEARYPDSYERSLVEQVIREYWDTQGGVEFYATDEVPAEVKYTNADLFSPMETNRIAVVCCRRGDEYLIYWIDKTTWKVYSDWPPVPVSVADQTVDTGQ